MDPSPTLRGTTTESAVVMRAHMASDLADAGRIVDQVKATLPFGHFQDARAARVQMLLQTAREQTVEAAALILDETFLPKPEDA